MFALGYVVSIAAAFVCFPNWWPLGFAVVCGFAMEIVAPEKENERG
jgi:hypothetical protein